MPALIASQALAVDHQHVLLFLSVTQRLQVGLISDEAGSRKGRILYGSGDVPTEF